MLLFCLLAYLGLGGATSRLLGLIVRVPLRLEFQIWTSITFHHGYGSILIIFVRSTTYRASLLTLVLIPFKLGVTEQNLVLCITLPSCEEKKKAELMSTVKIKETWKFGPMWQAKYASVVTMNLGLGFDFPPCSEGDFLIGHPTSVVPANQQTSVL